MRYLKTYESLFNKMKYIKLYEEMNSHFIVEINRTLEEICLELKDYGYTIAIRKKYDFTSNRGCYTIRISKDLNSHRVLFEFSEIKEYLLRMKEYLGNDYIGFSYNDGTDVNGFAYGNIPKTLDDGTDIEKLYRAEIDYLWRK